MTILPTKKKREREGPPKVNLNRVRIGRPTDLHREKPPHRKRPPPPSAASLLPSSSPSSSHSSNQSSRAPTPRRAPSVTSSTTTSSKPSTSRRANSDDEYENDHVRDDQLEADFHDSLKARGLQIKEMEGDGACMFRAIAEQIYGDQGMHQQIRKLCMDYMVSNKDYYADFITENFDDYIRRKRMSQVHGNHIELQAISEMFARPVEVYQYSDEPINILLPRGLESADGQSTTNQPNAPLRLSYHGTVHYNAIVDPNAATIGVGLGLPGMVPGSSDRELVTSALRDSERADIEESMLQDKINMTDWQRTQDELDEQITRESYMEYVRTHESRKKSPNNVLALTTSRKNSPNNEAEKKEEQPSSSTSKVGLYEELLAAQSLGLPSWGAYDEEEEMTRALLMSRQEFISQNTDSTQGSSRTG